MRQNERARYRPPVPGEGFVVRAGQAYFRVIDRAIEQSVGAARFLQFGSQFQNPPPGMAEAVSALQVLSMSAVRATLAEM
jgi:hypothetical protein